MKPTSLIFYLGLFIFMGTINSCGKSDSGSGGGGGATPTAVTILGMSYSPSSVSVKVGTVVKWTNSGGTAHTVTADNGTTFSSGNIADAGIFNYTTITTGTFPYHCLIHGVAMAGTLTVTP